MDPALLRERELFKKRAHALPTVEKKVKESSASSNSSKDVSKPKSRPSSSSGPRLDASNYKTMSGSSQYRFGVLAKIVKHMRTRHQEGDDHPLELEEILDETNQLDIGNSVRNWLQNEALRNNPKIEVTPEGAFVFKAVYKLRDGKSLIKLLRHQDLKGLGGVLLDDVQESLPHCEKVLKARANELITLTRPIDKKKVLFYNDRTCNFAVDDEFQKLWRSVTVDAMDDNKIEEYLEKQGIRSMQDQGPKKPLIPKRKKQPIKKKTFKKPRDNEHLADVLETYEENTLGGSANPTAGSNTKS
uniref:Transcription initiation factor IIE subunit beta n=1 Tax=Culicoides sonorensis TaxID=179676 RepID=A0A336LHH7_CULSO